MAGHDARDEHDYSILEPRSAPQGHATHENVKADTHTLGEASGGFLGAVGGMSLGIIGGPVGLVLGGIAGAAGGWWAGHGLANALTADDEAYFRSHYDSASPADRVAERDFERVRPAYVAGHLAGRNPDYAGRSFDDVEGDLRCGWSDDVASRCGDWPAVRPYARAAFERSRAEDRSAPPA
jgi:hypothetical protein